MKIQSRLVALSLFLMLIINAHSVFALCTTVHTSWSPNPYTLTSNTLQVGETTTGTSNMVLTSGTTCSTTVANVIWYPPSSTQISVGNTLENVQQPSTVSSGIYPLVNESAFIVNVISSNEISVTYNAITGTAATSATYNVFAIGTNTIAGVWTFNMVLYNAAAGLTSTTTNTIDITLYTPPSTPTLSSCPSATSLDVGQSVSCTASFTGGTSPYTYNWLVVNSITDAVVANMLYTGVTTTSNTFTYTTQSVDTANSPLAFNVVVTDSNPTTVNSVYSSTFAVNAVPSISISPSSATIDNGQSITLTASTSGGTLPISYAWYSGSTCSGTVLSTSASYSPSPSSTTTYCAEATDSATTAETSTSTVTVTVNSALGTPTLSPSTTQTLDNGQSVSFSTTWSGGTPSYTAYLYSSSTSSCSTSSTLVQTVSSATSPTSFTAQSPSSTTYYCSAIKDSASTPETTTSSATEVKVNSALGTPSISPTTANKYDYGQAIPFSSTWSGGTSTYTANWIVVNSITGTQLANALYSGISSTSNSFSWAFPSADAGNTVQANVLITDSATSPESTNSVKSATLTLNPSLTAYVHLIIGSNYYSAVTLDVGQSVTINGAADVPATSNPSGTPPYTYNFLIYNSVTNNIATNTLYTDVSSNSNSIIFTPTTPYATNTYATNVIITDSATTPTTVSSGSLTITVNPALTTPSISQTATSLDVGQSVTLTTSWSGGSPDYTVKWYSGTSSTCSSDTTLLATYSSLTGTSNSITESPTSTTYYCASVTDSASTPETTNSITVEVKVNPALAAGAITPSSPTIDNGQSVTLTANPSGGTAPYFYQWYTTSGTGGVSCTSANVISSATSSTYSASPTTTNSYAYNVTDSATTPESICSASDLVTVNSALSTPTLTSSPALPSTQIAGNTITFTSSWSGGTSSYTANYLITNTITGSLVANALYTGITTTSNTFVWTIPSIDVGNTLQANVLITDSASTPETTNSIKSGTLTIISPLSATVKLILPSQIYNGSNYAGINAVVTAGSSPFTFNIIVYKGGAEVANSLFTTSNTNEIYTLGNVLGASTYTVNTIISASGGGQEAFSNTLIISQATPTFTLKFTNPSGTIVSTLTTNDATETITSSGSFTISSQINSALSQLIGKMYIYKLVNGVPYFLNNTLIGTNTIPANYSTTYYKSTDYALNISTYAFVFNSTGNSNYTGFTANFIINQTTNQQATGSQSGGGGGGSATIACNFPNVFNATAGTCTPPLQAIVNATKNTTVSITTAVPSAPGNTAAEQFLIGVFGASFTIKNGIGTLSIPIWTMLIAMLLIITGVLYYKKSRYYYNPLILSVLIIIIYLSLSVAVYGGG